MKVWPAATVEMLLVLVMLSRVPGMKFVTTVAVLLVDTLSVPGVGTAVVIVLVAEVLAAMVLEPLTVMVTRHCPFIGALL